MARSLSKAGILSAALVEGISSSIKRRGFSAAASGGVARSGGRSSPVTPKKGVNEKVRSAHKVSWVPDPKTGYYRPDNVAAEMDVAEQREALLKQKN